MPISKQCIVGGIFLGAAGLAVALLYKQVAAQKTKDTVENIFSRAKMNALTTLLESAENVFDAADKNQDGVLDRKELHDLLVEDETIASMLERNSASQFYLFEQLDADHDGKITRADFIKAYLPAMALETYVHDIFTAADLDHDGRLSAAEVKAALEENSAFTEVLKIAGVETHFYVLEQLDIDHSGDVSLEEFLAAVSVLFKSNDDAAPADENAGAGAQ